MRVPTSIVLGVVLLVATGRSQTPKPADDAQTAKAGLAPAASSPKPERVSGQADYRTLRTSNSSAAPLWEYWVNITVPAGGTLDLDSGLDFSWSQDVRVTVRSDYGDLGDIALGAYWTIPQAPFFSVADVVSGGTFYYRNVGGATFNTYGSRFRLRIINYGAYPVTLRQVLLFTLGFY